MLALVLAVLAYPLAGAGFYVLGRRRRLVPDRGGALRLGAGDRCRAATSPEAVRVRVREGLTFVALAALVDILVAGPSTPQKGRVLLIAVLLVIAGRGGSFVVKELAGRGFPIPSGAMVPALLVGDRIMVRRAGRLARGDVSCSRPAGPAHRLRQARGRGGGDRSGSRRGVVDQRHPLDQTRSPSRVRRYRPRWNPAPCELLRETNAGRSYTIMFEPGARAPDFCPPWSQMVKCS